MTAFKSSSLHQIQMAGSIPHGKTRTRTCRRSLVDKNLKERHAATATAAASSVILV